MSEKEKKRRALYKKNREHWIFAQSVIVGVLTIAIIISALVSFQLDDQYYIGYREGGSINYNVFLKENEFYEEDYLGKNQSYVASLIDRIIADFSYEIEMDTDDVNYRYSYSINSRLEILDNTSKNAIFNPEYELVSVQNKSQSSSDRLRINEILVINYDEYNDLANKFLATYGLTNTVSNIVVTLEVDVLSDCAAFSGSAIETFTSELRIPLTQKTVNIKMTTAVPDAETNMIACTRGMGGEVFRTTAIVLGVVDALMIAILVAFIYLTRTPDVTYAARVKKILSQYKSYIQRIKNLFETRGYQLIMVDTFDEMLEIRDTIQAPILMHENADMTCCKFMIPTDSKLLYMYVISIEGYEEPKPEPVEENIPTTIVKPNITNVVRPVVKVVVTPPPSAPIPPKPADPEPVIETVFEEPEIEADEAVEVIAEAEELVEAEQTVAEVVEKEPIVESFEEAPVEETPVEETPVEEAPVEEAPVEEIEDFSEAEIEVVPLPLETETIDPEVEELIATIPEVVEEESGVDAIDVYWKERPEKTYRYDPDGNSVESGDVVLVPTRDVHRDTEVVREAEVVRGNYKVDPEALDHPLKKIIGVVRRRAEKIFTAMISPDEENEE